MTQDWSLGLWKARKCVMSAADLNPRQVSIRWTLNIATRSRSSVMAPPATTSPIKSILRTFSYACATISHSRTNELSSTKQEKKKKDKNSRRADGLLLQVFGATAFLAPFCRPHFSAFIAGIAGKAATKQATGFHQLISGQPLSTCACPPSTAFMAVTATQSGCLPACQLEEASRISTCHRPADLPRAGSG